MNRRQFVSTSGAAAVALTGVPFEPASAAPPKRALMKLGCQTAPTNEQHLQYLARYGVEGICGYPAIGDGRLYATVEELKRMRDVADKYRRSEEHTSELQSLAYLVCRLLLEKKKTYNLIAGR